MENLKPSLQEKAFAHFNSCYEQTKECNEIHKELRSKSVFLNMVISDRGRVEKAIKYANKKMSKKNVDRAVRRIDSYVEMVEVLFEEMDELVVKAGELKLSENNKDIQAELKAIKNADGYNRDTEYFIHKYRIKELGNKTVEARHGFEKVEALLDRYEIITKINETPRLEEFKQARKELTAVNNKMIEQNK
jgi:hypothetical protein